MEKNQTYGGQVYFDPQSGRYYTQPRQVPTQVYGFPNLRGDRNRTYLDQSPFSGSRTNQSMIGQMLANRQPYQYNAPSAQQMFPGMGNPMMGGMPSQSQGNPMLGGGLFGAGRFLGSNYANQAGLLGTSVSGT